MEKIDFYLLQQNDEAGFLYKLLEKLYKMKLRLFLLTENESESAYWDEALWSYEATSFLPHLIYNAQSNNEAPILIADKGPSEAMDVLINLKNEAIPETITPFFKRGIEIVRCDETAKQLSREKYQYYRTQAYVMQVHNL